MLVLVGLIVLFVLSLCIPFDAVLDWDSTKQLRPRLRLVWLFGLVSFAPGRETRAKTAPQGEKKPRRKPGMKKMLKIITTEGLFGKVAAFVKSSLRQIRIAQLEGDIRLKLDDPADAAFVYAVLGAVYPVFRSTRLNRIRIEPVLGEEVMIRGNARMVVRLQPIRLVVPSLKFSLSRPAFSAMKTVIAG